MTLRGQFIRYFHRVFSKNPLIMLIILPFLSVLSATLGLSLNLKEIRRSILRKRDFDEAYLFMSLVVFLFFHPALLKMPHPKQLIQYLSKSRGLEDSFVDIFLKYINGYKYGYHIAKRYKPPSPWSYLPYTFLSKYPNYAVNNIRGSILPSVKEEPIYTIFRLLPSSVRNPLLLDLGCGLMPHVGDYVERGNRFKIDALLITPYKVVKISKQNKK